MTEGRTPGASNGPGAMWRRLAGARLPAVPETGREVWPWWLFLVGGCLVLPFYLSRPELRGETVPLLRAVAFAVVTLLARWRPGLALAATVLLQLPLPVEGGVSPPWFLDAMLAQIVVTLAGAAALAGRTAVVLTGLVLAAGAARAVAGAATGAWELQVGPPLLLWIVPVGLACAAGLRRAGRVRTALDRIAEQRREHVRDERVRIGRELHDVVAHQLSVLAVRAASASRRVPEVSGPAAAEFDEIAALSRGALGDMRRLVGVLRSGPDDDGPGDGGPDHGGPADRSPQPGVADLPRLAEATRGAGCPVELTTDGADRLPDVLAVSVYRIVQEALANAVRHATGAPIRVRIDATGTGPVRVEVVNGAPPSPPVPDPGAGAGLPGLTERVRLLGGDLATGPTPDGGFSVRATLPREATWSPS